MEELDILSYNEEDDTLNDVLTKKKYESASEVLQNYERLKKSSIDRKYSGQFFKVPGIM